MTTLTFRNKHGDLVDIPTVAATRLKNEFGTILEQTVRSGAIAITKHDTPKAVLLSYEEFEALVKMRSFTLEQHSAQYDALLSHMQTPEARKGMKAAFDASPLELGRAAVERAAATGVRHEARRSTPRRTSAHLSTRTAKSPSPAPREPMSAHAPKAARTQRKASFTKA